MGYDPAVAEVARATVQQLTPQFGPQLEVAVEEALHNEEGARTPTQYVDPTSIGILIVSIATLAWEIYEGMKKPGEKPTKDALAGRIRYERRKHTDLAAAEEKVIEIVSIEILELHSEDDR
jgi:hypothetical protein